MIAILSRLSDCLRSGSLLMSIRSSIYSTCRSSLAGSLSCRCQMSSWDPQQVCAKALGRPVTVILSRKGKTFQLDWPQKVTTRPRILICLLYMNWSDMRRRHPIPELAEGRLQERQQSNARLERGEVEGCEGWLLSSGLTSRLCSGSGFRKNDVLFCSPSLRPSSRHASQPSFPTCAHFSRLLVHTHVGVQRFRMIDFGLARSLPLSAERITIMIMMMRMIGKGLGFYVWCTSVLFLVLAVWYVPWQCTWVPIRNSILMIWIERKSGRGAFRSRIHCHSDDCVELNREVGMTTSWR